MNNVKRYIVEFYSGTIALLFTMTIALPGLIVISYALAWVVKSIVWAFKLAW